MMGLPPELLSILGISVIGFIGGNVIAELGGKTISVAWNIIISVAGSVIGLKYFWSATHKVLMIFNNMW